MKKIFFNKNFVLLGSGIIEVSKDVYTLVLSENQDETSIGFIELQPIEPAQEGE